MRKLGGQLFSGIVRGVGFGIGLLLLLVAALVAQSLNNFQPGDLVSASQINANFTNIKTTLDTHQTNHDNLQAEVNVMKPLQPPVGAIIAWHRDLGSGAGALPAGWRECDGTQILDSDSPFDGDFLPDLNGGTRFLRGGGASGTMQGYSVGPHNHRFKGTHSTAAHGDPIGGHCAIHTTDRADGCLGGGIRWDYSLIDSNGGPETRPVNMSVVWIMRIK